MINTLEDLILHVTGTRNITVDNFPIILDEISKLQNMQLIGCKDHYKVLTKKITEFYVVTRAEFIAKSFNLNMDDRRLKTLRNRKAAKV